MDNLINDINSINIGHYIIPSDRYNELKMIKQHVLDVIKQVLVDFDTDLVIEILEHYRNLFQTRSQTLYFYDLQSTILKNTELYFKHKYLKFAIIALEHIYFYEKSLIGKDEGHYYELNLDSDEILKDI